MSEVHGSVKPAAAKAPDLSPPVKGNGQRKEAVKNPDGSAAPKAPAEKKDRAPRQSNFSKLYPEASKITLLAEANPKRPGTKAHETFALYGKSATVGDFLKAGGFYQALSWDVGHGFVKVEAAPTA